MSSLKTSSYFLPSFLASCSIVRSFEVIVGIFAQQVEDGECFSFTTETILFVAELVSGLHPQPFNTDSALLVTI